MCEAVWLLQSVRVQSVRASLSPPCRVVLYGLGEHPFRRWGGGRSSVFQLLLEAGFTPRVASALREAKPEAPGHFELLAATGWHRFGTAFSGGIYRVVVALRPGTRFDHLTAREFGVAELAARGWKSQRIGLELGIASATARGALDRTALKLGLASAVQLPLLWFAIGSGGRCFLGASGARYLMYEASLSSLLAPLTRAERDLVERLLHGDTQRAMAEHRGVSVSTVSNQMSRLFEKFEVSSRSELVVRLIEIASEG